MSTAWRPTPSAPPLVVAMALAIAVLAGACSSSAAGPSGTSSATVAATGDTSGPSGSGSPPSLPERCRTASGTAAGTDPLPGLAVPPADSTVGTPPPRAAGIPSFHLRGRVVDGVCRTPVTGVAIWIYAADDAQVPVTSSSTGDDGTYDVSLPRGRYKLAFQQTSSNYDFVWFKSGEDFPGATEVALRADQQLADVALYGPADQPVPDYVGDGDRRIAVIGDSLVQQSATVIQRELELIGPTSVRGIANQRIDEMQPVATRYAATDPDTVVIALGNNDANQGTALDDSLKALASMINSLPTAKCVVVLDINTRTPNPPFNTRAEAINEKLPDLVPFFPQLHIAPWNLAVNILLASGDDKAWFTDGLHLTDRAIPVYAKVMTDAIDAC